MSAIATFLAGWIIVVIGVAVGAYLLNVPALWVLGAGIILLTVGIVAVLWRTKPPDPPSG